MGRRFESCRAHQSFESVTAGAFERGSERSVKNSFRLLEVALECFAPGQQVGNPFNILQLGHGPRPTGSQNYYGVLISQAQADFAIPIVDRISRDRISDIACNLLKSFLVDYTIHQSAQYAAAAYRFRKGHTEFDEADRKWYWVARGKTSDLH